MNEYFNKKFQKIGSFLLVFIMMFSLIGTDFLVYAQSNDSKIEYYNGGEETPFEFNEETGTIIGYKGGNAPENLMIPETINGVRVKHIGNKAFFKQKSIKQISFPQSLETVGEEAFRHCELNKIQLPGNIKAIKSDAFNNSGLTEVIFEEGLESLGANSFANNSITNVVIPESVKGWPTEDKKAVFSSNKIKLGDWTGKSKFVKVYNNSGATSKNTFGIVNPALVTIEYKDEEGNNIQANRRIVGKELKKAKNIGSNWDPKLIIEEGRKEYLTNYEEPYDIGHHIVSILDEISENYYQINKEYIFEPEEIEGYTKPEEQKIRLDKKENTIIFIYTKEGEEPKETPFEFNEATGTITGYKDGNSPENLVIPETINDVEVKYIGEGAFRKKVFGQGNINTIIKNVEIGKNVETIGKQSFQGHKINHIGFSDSNNLKIIGEKAFYGNELETLEIPSSTKKIDEKAFENNKITKLILNEGLEAIEENAFGSNSIEEIELPNSIKELPTRKKNAIFSNNKIGNNFTLVKVYTKNKIVTPENTFGIINPVKVTIEYKYGENLDKKISLGRKNKILNRNKEIMDGRGEDILSYSVSELNEDEDSGNTGRDRVEDRLNDLSENYYQMNKEYTFIPEEKEGYTKPEAQTVKLDNKENTITFVYTEEGDLEKPDKIELCFPGNKQVTPLNPGGKQIIFAKVLNGKGEEIKGEKVKFKSSNPDVLKHSFLDTFIAGEVVKETEVTITAILESNSEIIGSTNVIVSPRNRKVDLDEEIDFLKRCYEAYMTEASSGTTGNAGLSMLAPGAARLAGMDINKIQKHLYIDEKNESAYQLAQSIITLIGADLDPRQYNDKGKVRNLVKELADLQQYDGENKGEFIGKNTDKNSVESLARTIIALDMAGAKYDEEKAILKLIEIYDKKDSHTYKDIKTEGIVLVALSNYKDVDGVGAKINEILNYLKTKQNEDGGFDIKYGFEKGTNSPTATGRVIQGLIANGINPLEDEEWIKNGSTMLNAIVRSKTVNENIKNSGYGKGEEDEYTYYESTYTAFGALTDLKNQKSMFELLKLELDTDAKVSRVKIVKPDKAKIEVGQSLALIAKIYDKDGKVLQGQELIWESSDENIATVKGGNIEAKKAGESIITVKVKDTEIQDTFKIVVIDEVKVLEVNTSIIVFDEFGNYKIKSNPQKIAINKNEHDGGFTVFGALQATTDEYEGSGDWITSIYGISGPDIGGWMFAVNGRIPNVGANQVKLNKDDKVIWFCTYDYKRDKAPSWEELIVGQEIDKTKLEEVINRAEKVDIEGKTEESVKTLENAILKGKEILGKEKVTQEEIDSVVRAIEAAMSNLEDKEDLELKPEIDKTKLKEVLNKAEKIDTEGKKKESIRDLNNAILKGREIFESKTATQEEVNKTLELLKAAINGLKVKPTDPKEPMNPVEPKDPKDEDNDKKLGVPTKPQKPNKLETINKSNSETVKPNIQDKSTKTSLPKTGQSSMMWISILGVTLLAIGIWINKRRHKEI